MITIFGFSISTELLFLLFIAAIGVLMLTFYRNRKYNLTTIKTISTELEAALQPKDQTYTWLGGAVGFRADYQTTPPLQKVEATVTMLSRQSLLFFPISKLLFGNDRLFVVLYPFEKFSREAHIIDHWYYKLRLQKLEHATSLKHQRLDLHGKQFDVFAHNQNGLQTLVTWMRGLSTPEVIKHVAIMPENGTLYLYMIPRVGMVDQTVKALMNLLPQ